MIPLLAAVLLASAIALVTSPGLRKSRAVTVLASRTDATQGPLAESPTPVDHTQNDSRRRWAACSIAALGVWFVIGSALGVILGVLVAVAGPWALSRLEPSAVRQRREQLSADAPLAADLLAACVASGATTVAALEAVTNALTGPTAEVLDACVQRLALGADPRAAWGVVAVEPALAPIARAMIRSSESGAPLAEGLMMLAEELRSRRRGELEVLARAVGVKAVGPLGLCFLPAFVLLGVVPLIGSLVSQMMR